MLSILIKLTMKKRIIRSRKRVRSTASGDSFGVAGNQSKTTSLAITLLEELHDVLRHSMDWKRAKMKQIRFTGEQLSHFGLLSTQDPSWHYLNDLLHHPSLFRVWDLQELVLAKKPPTIVNADKVLHWDDFKAASIYLKELGWDRSILRNSLYRAETRVGPII